MNNPKFDSLLRLQKMYKDDSQFYKILDLLEESDLLKYNNKVKETDIVKSLREFAEK